MIQALLQRIPILYEPQYALNVTEKSYLDIFPREKLVYLSPHARDELMSFDEDEIYIVGAMVDKTDPRPFSLAKSKKEGLRIKKLPLDRFMDWGLGGKSLTINQMGNIMLDLRHTKDWEKAFRFVPRRKLRHYDDEEAGGRERDFKPKRRYEGNSQVLTDFELTHRRKGFRSHNSDRSSLRKPNLKTIMSDY
jgi:ribonuclease P protein 1